MRAQTDSLPLNTAGSVINTKEYLLGKFDYSQDTSFELIPVKYSRITKQYLRKEVLKHFIEMAEDAKKDSVFLYVLSATRNFEEQKRIWNDKWTGKVLVFRKNLALIKDTVLRAKEILKYSSMPSASRHHWGTDVDLDAFNNLYFKRGQGLKIYNWLVKNARKYGFCNPYNEKGKLRDSGYEEERWHWSYYPIANDCIERYFEEVTYEDIKGFLGSGTAKEIGIIKNYILTINSDCR